MLGHVIIADHSCLGVFNGSYVSHQQFELLLTELPWIFWWATSDLSAFIMLS